ncbi:DedA family protein [Candidatus Pantoea multigeneris]|uniref:DedA family protein n=1 Tax=Candidatus Pantoea multigeneris TaxID=2608357 RepID=A0ABX0R5Q1_9GAMM|nr:DedA family protein [Pantoea multigeneris]NIF20738.1 DedA family protein [Pantoea multigeneris]
MHIDINGLISQYGYLALLIGCLAEGETFTLLGGIAAHEGLLHYGGVLLAAMVGGTLGDQILFWVGRRWGAKILRRFGKHRDKIAKAKRLIQRRPSLFVIGVRFMYGFRLIGPVIIGASRLKPLKFFVLNLVGAALWSLIFVTLGYFAGEIVTPWLHKLDQHFKHLLWLIAALVFALILRWFIRRWNNRRAG